MNHRAIHLTWRQATRFCLSASVAISTATVPAQAVTPTHPPATLSSHSGVMLIAKQSRDRRIEVRLAKQRLLAWEGNALMYAAPISSGKSVTPTPIGTYAIQDKYRTTRMKGRGYDIPDVPYAMFFSGGYAIHGAYWHNAFGTPVSHGCVNLAPGDARWLYNWAPVGTPIVIRR